MNRKLMVIIGICSAMYGKIPFKERLLFLKKGIAAHVLPSKNNWYKKTSLPGDVTEQRKLFGYDLGIEYQYGCGHKYNKTKHRAILYLHPWGIIGMPHKRSADLLKYYNVLPGDVIVFNFPDGGWRAPFPFLYSSFGQLSDVLPAIYVLAYAYEHFGLQAVDIFGYSRGGAVAINMIAVLNNKYHLYDNELAYIGINEQKRLQLLQIIQQGTLVLNCPLADVNSTFDMYSYMLRSFFFKFTRYKADGLQGLQSAHELDGLSLKVLLHFQFNDQRVFNIKDAELYRIFKQQNPETTFLVLGNDGGHLHTQATLAKAIHDFYKNFNGAYDRLMVQHQHSSLLLQPAYSDAARFIQEFYNQCAAKKKHD